MGMKVINEVGLPFGLLNESTQDELMACHSVFLWTQRGCWSKERSPRFCVDRSYKGEKEPIAELKLFWWKQSDYGAEPKIFQWFIDANISSIEIVEYTKEVQKAVEFARKWEGKKLIAGNNIIFEFIGIDWNQPLRFNSMLEGGGISSNSMVDYDWQEYKEQEMIPLDDSDINQGDALDAGDGWQMIQAVNKRNVFTLSRIYTYEYLFEDGGRIRSIDGEWRKCEKVRK